MDKFKQDIADYKLWIASRSIKHIIGLQIRKARLKRAISQWELAKELGVDQNYISKIECGKVNMSVETLFKICHYLDCYFKVFEKDETKPAEKLTPCLRNKNKDYVEYIL